MDCSTVSEAKDLIEITLALRQESILTGDEAKRTILAITVDGKPIFRIRKRAENGKAILSGVPESAVVVDE